MGLSCFFITLLSIRSCVLSARNNNGSQSWNSYIQSSKGVTADAWKYAIKFVSQYYWQIGQENRFFFFLIYIITIYTETK